MLMVQIRREVLCDYVPVDFKTHSFFCHSYRYSDLGFWPESYISQNGIDGVNVWIALDDVSFHRWDNVISVK